MSQSSKKIEKVYEEFNNQADRINYLIKKVIILLKLFYLLFYLFLIK